MQHPLEPGLQKQHGEPGSGRTVDPTENVLALVAREVQRLDDLRLAEKELADEKAAHLKEIAVLRETHRTEIDRLIATYQRDLKVAEAGRVDSIRQVDREDVAKTAAANQLATAALDATTKQLAATLQQQVGTVAQAAEARQSVFAGEVNKRLSALELSSSEGRGRSAYADPRFEDLLNKVESLRESRAGGMGKSAGMSALWAFGVAAVGVLILLATFVMRFVK